MPKLARLQELSLGLIETRVVFEFRFKVVSNLPQARLIETRVVFESVIKIINAYVKID